MLIFLRVCLYKRSFRGLRKRETLDRGFESAIRDSRLEMNGPERNFAKPAPEILLFAILSFLI